MVSDNKVLPVGGKVDVEVHQVVGEESEHAAKEGQVEHVGEDGALQLEHGDWEGVQASALHFLPI